MRLSSRDLAVNIGKNTVYGVAASLSQVLTRIVTVPTIVAFLGVEGYGIWSIIMATGAYMRFGSAGMKSAFQKYVAEGVGKDDHELTSKLLSTGTFGILAISLVALVPVAFFSRTLAAAAGVPARFMDSASSSITLLALLMMLSNFAAVYEAIVMGANRIDVVRRGNIVCTVSEAIAIIVAMHLGLGLFAMSVIMTISEIGLIIYCWIAARRILPQVKVRPSYVSRSVVRELFRFAGSYQLVNVLEVIYIAVLPVGLLRISGASAAGVYALADRLVGFSGVIQQASLVPLLSGATMVYASGAAEQLRQLISKSFKVTLLLTLPPLSLIAMFGTTLLLAWTGQTSALFVPTLAMAALGGFFRAISLLGLVLYRITGGAKYDLVRQSVRLLIVCASVMFGRRWGFYAVLAGLVVAEAAGMLFMVGAAFARLKWAAAKMVVADTIKLAAATAGVVAVSKAVMHFATWLPFQQGRMGAFVQLAEIGIVATLAAWPALKLTNYFSATELRTMADVIKRRYTHTQPLMEQERAYGQATSA